MECKAGSGSPLYLMMQKRYETEVAKLSQNNPSFFAVKFIETDSFTGGRPIVFVITGLRLL